VLQPVLRTHVKPALGEKRLQVLRAPEIDKLYADLEMRTWRPSAISPLGLRTTYTRCSGPAWPPRTVTV
jgi:hypothetical protein